MIKPNAFAKDADQVGYFEPSEESELFAKRLVSAISKGGDHISLTLTGKVPLPLPVNSLSDFWLKNLKKLRAMLTTKKN